MFILVSSINMKFTSCLSTSKSNTKEYFWIHFSYCFSWLWAQERWRHA